MVNRKGIKDQETGINLRRAPSGRPIPASQCAELSIEQPGPLVYSERRELAATLITEGTGQLLIDFF